MRSTWPALSTRPQGSPGGMIRSSTIFPLTMLMCPPPGGGARSVTRPDSPPARAESTGEDDEAGGDEEGQHDLLDGDPHELGRIVGARMGDAAREAGSEPGYRRYHTLGHVEGVGAGKLEDADERRRLASDPPEGSVALGGVTRVMFWGRARARGSTFEGKTWRAGARWTRRHQHLQSERSIQMSARRLSL